MHNDTEPVVLDNYLVAVIEYTAVAVVVQNYCLIVALAIDVSSNAIVQCGQDCRVGRRKQDL